MGRWGGARIGGGAGIEPRLDLPGYFRLEIGIADVERRDGGSPASPNRGTIGLHRGERVRLLARRAPRRPELQRGQEVGAVEEARVGHHPGGADLGVDHEVVIDAERAVVVAAQRAGQEEAVVPGELLLPIEPDRLVLEIEVRILEALAESAAAHRIDAANPEDLALSGDLG